MKYNTNLKIYNTKIYLKNKILLQKTGLPYFSSKFFRLKTQYFYTNLPSQKPMLRKIEWEVQNGPITKNGVLPGTTLFFWRFCFSLRISYKELIWCTNYPNFYIHVFRNCWTFIWSLIELKLISSTWPH